MCKICTVLLHVAFLHVCIGRWACAIGTCKIISYSGTIHLKYKCPSHEPLLHVFCTMTENMTNENASFHSSDQDILASKEAESQNSNKYAVFYCNDRFLLAIYSEDRMSY